MSRLETEFVEFVGFVEFMEFVGFVEFTTEPGDSVEIHSKSECQRPKLK